MTRSSNSIGPICLGLLAGAIVTSSAAAQAVTPGADTLVGPVVPGVCALSRDAVFADAKVGQAIDVRLKNISRVAQSEIDDERQPLLAEIKALEEQKTTLPAAQFEARSKPLVARMEALQRKANLRSREIEATRAKALARIATEAQPIIAKVYGDRKCGVLFAREAMLGGNPAADLTPAIIAALDAKIVTLDFQRETLPDEALAAPRAK
ncbi:OmpH family outer membrane protein [Caulobacter soli]|uniref:OmpH family outer membrane protein n=1 Tax=Caulobacter soli TaxID=2708539 RepID=UPI0013EC1C5B|nr:OmpH family outer membrane protein [Caulobacter soli]